MAEPAIDRELEAGDPYLVNAAERQRRNSAFVRMIRDWLDDETGYDESTWPIVRDGVERERAIAGDAPLFDG